MTSPPLVTKKKFLQILFFFLFRFLEQGRSPKMVLTKNSFSPKIFKKIFSGISSISVFGTGPMSENSTNREFFFSPPKFLGKIFPLDSFLF